jgi:hypothetical protein
MLARLDQPIAAIATAPGRGRGRHRAGVGKACAVIEASAAAR